MHDFDPVARFPKMFPDVFGDHHGAVLPASTPERDGQVTLAFLNVVRQEIDEQLRDTFDELFRLRERSDVFRHPRVSASEGAEFGHKMRVGQKTYIEDQVRIFGYAVTETEAHARDQNVFIGGCVLLELLGNVSALFVNIKF